MMEPIKTLNGSSFKDMAAAGAAMVEQSRDTLNALNVFPVPDGDTGTNMSATFVAAAREAAQVTADPPDMNSVLSALAAGALRGARGNSGVILSQLVAGFADAYRGSAGRAYDVAAFAHALERGREMAYDAVMRPKEGTILTVAADIAKAARTYADKYDDFIEFFRYILKEGNESLRRTQDMMPVLREAGVVDAGAAGWIAILSGFQASLEGRTIDADSLLKTEQAVDFANITSCDRDLEFGYCTEFFIRHLFPEVRMGDINKFREELGGIGDCVLVVGDTDLVKVHVHTNTPGTALNYALQLGELSSIKIDNMREQHRELQDGAAAIDRPMQEMGVTAVVSGEGFRNVFMDCQVGSFVEGGQSMNPSAAEIAEAVRSAGARHVIVLPNNKNIILAAEQAGHLVDCDVSVLKTRTLPEGVAAAIVYDPDASADQNLRKMNDAFKSVWTGSITHAVRDAVYKGTSVSRGDIIGISRGEIEASGTLFAPVVLELLTHMPLETELITMYYGNDVDEKTAEEVCSIVQEHFPTCDVDLLYGGQPIYDFIISAE